MDRRHQKSDDADVLTFIEFLHQLPLTAVQLLLSLDPKRHSVT